MSLAREVAEAYIQVHGDMSPFRKELEKMTADAAKEAQKSADSFADGWNKRVSEKTKGQWEALQDGFFNGKSFDWDRAIGKFDSANLEDAREKMHGFLDEMDALGKFGEKNSGIYRDFGKALDDMVDKKLKLRDATKAYEEEQKNEALAVKDTVRYNQMWSDQLKGAYEEATRDDKAWNNRRAQTMSEAIADNEKFNRSFDGMIKNMKKDDMEGDFKRIAEAVKNVDFSGFAKNYDTFDQLRKRVIEVTDAMQEQGRISKQSSDIARGGVENYIRDEQGRLKAIQDTLDATKRAREETDKYKNSLDGMVEGAKVGRLEQDFRNLAKAIESNDFSNIAKGHEDMDSLRLRTYEVLAAMKDMGRISPEEINKVRKAMNEANIEFKKVEETGRSFESLRNAIDKVGNSLQSAWNISRGFREHLGGFAGLNIFQDMIHEGLDFVHNLDRIALSASIATTKLTAMASIGGTAMAGIVVIAKDIADSLAGVSVLLPAFATGAGIMAFIAITALGGITKKYKDEIKSFKEDIANQVNVGFDPAMDKFMNTTLPTLKQGIKDTSAAMGRLFGTILDSITQSNTNEAIQQMFQRMNDAMDKSHIGINALVDAWSVLGQVGSKYFDRFAEGFNKMSTKFDDFINKSAKNGNLDKWINNGIEGMKDLGRALDGAFGIFNAIDSAAKAAGIGGLKTFADNLQGAAKTMQNIAFQRTLTTYLLGMKDVTDKVFESIGKLGPAFESLAPTVQIAMGHIGEAISMVIGYIGDIFSNPNFQKGLRDFTGGIETATGKLAPAVKPFGDAIGQTLSLLSEVLVSIAEIVTAVTVNWHPVFTSMSKDLESLIVPLRNSVDNFVREMTPLLQSVADNVIHPLVKGIKEDLLPAIDNIMPKVKDFGESVSKNLGELIKPVVEKILPDLIRLAGDLLVPLGKLIDLFTPIASKEINDMADGLHNLADGIDAASKSVNANDGGKSFGEWFAKWWDDGAAKTKLSNDKSSQQWMDILNWFGDGFKWLWDQVVNAFDKYILNPKAWQDLFNGIGDMISKSVGAKAVEDIKKALGDWWAGVRGMFQDWFKDTFGFGGKESVFKGATIGGKGMGAGAKLGPEIFDDKAETNWFADFFKGISKQWDDFWSGVNDTVTKWGNDIKSGWDGFWGGLGTKVSDTGTEMGTNISNFATDAQTNLSNFGTDVTTNWNTFWGDVGTTLSTKWGEFTSTVSTKSSEIDTNVQSFGTTVQTNWNSFWGTVGTTLSQKWGEFTSTVSTKSSELGSSVSTMGSNVQNGWNTTWASVGTVLSTKWQEFYNTVTTKGTEVSSWVGDLPGKISSAFGSGWDILTAAGSAIMGSLKAGLDSRWDEVKNFVGGIAQWIKDNKGPISYDKTLLVPAGEAIMGGLHSSMKDKFADVMVLVSSMASSIAGAFKDSAMYAQGKDAAKGLADGLIAGKIDVAAAYADLGKLPPITANVGQIGQISAGTSSRGSGTAVPAGGVVFQPGAVQINTPATDPALVASMTIDGIASTYSKL